MSLPVPVPAPAPFSLRLVKALASLRLTLIGIALFAAATLAVYRLEHSATVWMAAPLLLLAVNLAAAVATNSVFRRQLPLLLFHLALIAIVLLAAAGRLTDLRGTAEVAEGTAFNGLVQREAGPLHNGRLDAVRFVNEGFDVRYLPGPIRDRTVNRVRWVDEDGRERVDEIGDNRPLVLFGYRFYPTFNKGFAPVLLWRPATGGAVLGAVHLPSYPANAAQQAKNWRPPGSKADIWVMLDIPEDLIPADKSSHFRLPDESKLVLRYLDTRWELRPGERVSLPDGVVEYRELRTWMGYTVFYDWTITWLLSASLLAVAALSWHFWRKFSARPWNQEAEH